MATLQEEIANLLNRYSRENASDTPDFILGQYLMSCLEAFEKATRERDEWGGGRPPPGLKPGPAKDMLDKAENFWLASGTEREMGGNVGKRDRFVERAMDVFLLVGMAAMVLFFVGILVFAICELASTLPQ